MARSGLTIEITSSTRLTRGRTTDSGRIPALAHLCRRAAVVVCALATVAVLFGCSAQPNRCAVGESIQCACSSGATGTQICQTDEKYGACQCDTGDPNHAPEESALDNDSGFDTSDLDPLPENTGGDAALQCIRWPTPGQQITQGEHGDGRAIDLGCTLGDPLINPLPAQAVVTHVVTGYSAQHNYDSLADYLAVCGSSANPAPTDASACNNYVVLQTTIAGITWKISMLHIDSSYVEVGDVVQPFQQVAACGTVGWSTGPHVHLTLNSSASGYKYPGPYLNTQCTALSSPGTCPANSACCTASGEYVLAGQNGPSCAGSCNACNGAGTCLDTCTSSCPAGDGLYCGGSTGVNLDPTRLYNCVAGVFTVAQTCTNGCHQASPGNPDYCEPSSMTCPDGNGLYCGITLGLNNDTLYNCQNGNNTVSANCQYGCHVAPPGNPDYCEPPPSGCPSGNGLYCGSNNILQYCQNGNYSFNSYCSAGCVMAPPGYPDYCASGSCPSGNGLYCGTVSGNLNNNTLYNCQNGAYTIQQVCSQCVVAPPGYADYCA